jgi:subtilisin family serine protease
MPTLRYHSRRGTVVPNTREIAAKYGLKAPLLAFCATIAGVTACGADPSSATNDPGAVDPRLVDDAEPAPLPDGVVVHARPQDVAAGVALDASYIVTFRSEGSGDRLDFANYHNEFRDHYMPLAARFAADPRVRELQFITSVDLSPSADGLADGHDAFWDLEFGAPEILRRAWRGLPASRRVVGSMARVDFTDRVSGAAAVDEWARAGRLWFAEPNYVSRLSNNKADVSFADLKTSYAGLGPQYWWVSVTDLANAFTTVHEKLGKKADDVSAPPYRPIIAVLDSGVDYKHPALENQIWVNNDMNAANCADDLHGCDTTVNVRGMLGRGDVYPYDSGDAGESCLNKDPNCSHGTHVAGIIAGDFTAANPETGLHVAGVCPVCQIMIVKIVSKVGKQSGILDSSILAGFKYVTLFNHGGDAAVRVINASFGKFVRSRSVGLLVRLMKEKRGMLLVGAAGNEDTLRMEYPAAFTDAVAVAAIDSSLRKVSFSNFGRWVDVAAPGNAIYSTVPGALYDSKSGTSMAAPFVAGVAGLMVAADPTISFSDLRSWLLQSADPSLYGADKNGGLTYRYYYPKVKQENGERQPLLGNGVLNANRAVRREPADGLPVYAELDRVKPGCSVVAAPKNGGPAPVKTPTRLFLLILATPLALVAAYNRQVIRAMLRNRRSSP